MSLAVDPVAVEREATVSDIAEIAAFLQRTLGQKVTAYLSGLRDPKVVGRWSRHEITPRDPVKMRLRAGYQAARMLVDAYGTETAKAWFFGTNTRLADLRPSTEALRDFARLFGDRRAIPAGVVSTEWRRAHALAPATITLLDGDLVDLDDLAVRRRLERRHAALLAAHAMPHLDISQVRSRDRVVTQTISRALFEEGAAGIRFRSNLDDGPCAV